MINARNPAEAGGLVLNRGFRRADQQGGFDYRRGGPLAHLALSPAA